MIRLFLRLLFAGPPNAMVLLAFCSTMASSNSGLAVAQAPGKSESIPKAEITTKGPVGLYYMQKYWIATRHLEKSVWYFATDGQVYENPTGLSREALAAHQGGKGILKFSGDVLEIVWKKGQPQKDKIERDEGDRAGFAWDTGMFAPAKPIKDAKSIAGIYEGGSSMSFGGGSTMVAKTLDLNANGTFKTSGIASVAAASDGTVAKVAGENTTTGTWSTTDFSLTLQDSSGKTASGIAFPLFEDQKTKTNDRLFFQGFVYKRK
jgi:hypothetical protein